jgi:hypothetical protein
MPAQGLPQLFFRYFPSFIIFTLILCNTYHYYVSYEDCSLGNRLIFANLSSWLAIAYFYQRPALPDRWHQIDLVDANGVEYLEYAESLVMGSIWQYYRC